MSTPQGSPYDCSGRTYLVTGAASGIGRQSAFLIASMGGRVVGVDRADEGLRETIRQMPGDDHHGVVGDLKVAEDVARLLPECPALDGVVHCAGVIKLYPLKLYNERRVGEITDNNWRAPVLLTADLLRQHKLRDGASIVFVSSIMSDVGTELNGIYAATKGALVATARCLALELAPKRIRVNCISPAFVKTPMLDHIGRQTDLAPFEKRHPLGFGEPEDVAHAVLFLLTDASRWVTGTNLIVDGGYSAT